MATKTKGRNILAGVTDPRPKREREADAEYMRRQFPLRYKSDADFEARRKRDAVVSQAEVLQAKAARVLARVDAAIAKSPKGKKVWSSARANVRSAAEFEVGRAADMAKTAKKLKPTDLVRQIDGIVEGVTTFAKLAEGFLAQLSEFAGQIEAEALQATLKV